MRILVIGAGALGGYFGARLLAAGRNVTFLVRPKRAEALAKGGLVVKSKVGDLHLASPPTVTSERLNGPYDLIIVSCKAYDLDGAMESFAPAVGKNSVIIPLLNGMRHLDVLNARFGEQNVFGGQCAISASLSAEGEILHMTDLHTLSFGEQNRTRSERRAEIVGALSGAGFDAELSDDILQAMWEKWVMIATIAGATCLMRASMGDIVAAGASDVVIGLLDEASAIAAKQGFGPRPAYIERVRSILTTPGSPLMASMVRDIERGAPTEGDHILGDLLGRVAGGEAPVLLSTAYAHVKAYEARRARENPRLRSAG
ncbi:MULTISPECIES: ketopantoate reductase family protein [unclassified Bradyrhizobium]|uniref:ketopantoate reductase family protein n=1 Tax=unclassified Bradyrhizobium TaxID=2631580 RepID=UPI001FF193C7|nr:MULTISPECIES: ketopantoate reductase family protein [unclassified Bradyrhizobium]MCJ9700296.1 ketopantoate reductase family protein [Bradyrhizobium sp. SHOUNA76]MCJ9729030.1 ketopantoate reductase family protein [Bradyrhizobium sp. PRIMUS42]